MPKAIVYCRVSTDEQAKEGYSLAAQERICRAYAERLGYEPDVVFIERGESAKTTHRTELQKLLQYASKNHDAVDALIVYKLDRLSRNMVDYTNLTVFFAKAGIAVKSATEQIDETSTGRLMKNVIASFAQFDNDVRAERTKSGMMQALKEGRWVWTAPTGYKNDRDERGRTLLTPTPEAGWITEIFGLFVKGIYTQAEIVRRMRRKGFEKLTKQSLTYILRRPIYAGLIKTAWLADYIKGVHKPLISEETFWKAQAILDGRKPPAVPRQRNHPDFPLRCFLKCPLCQKKLTGSWSKGRDKKYAYYHCRTTGCSYRNIPKQETEERFYAFLRQLQPSEAVLRLFSAIVEDVWEQKHTERIQEQNRLEIELRKLENRKKRIEELVIQGTFNQQTYKEQVEEIERELLGKRVELNEAKIDRLDVESCLNYCRYWLKNLAKLWANADVNLKQRFQALVCPQGAHYQDGNIGTDAISPIFNLLQTENLEKSKVAAPLGFEPR